MIIPANTDDKIYFLNSASSFDDFSTYSDHPIIIDGLEYKTVEHYIQTIKFIDTDYRNLVRTSLTTEEMHILSRSKIFPIFSDWYRGRAVDETINGYYAKFSQHPELKEMLLRTNNKLIVNCSTDMYWGRGKLFDGRNLIGMSLMKARDRIRKDCE